MAGLAKVLGAQGTMTLTLAPAVGGTFNINGTTLTVVSALSGIPNVFLPGLNAAQAAANIANAVNLNSDASDTVKATVSGPFGGQVVFTARENAGNAFVFTEAMTNTTVDGSGTLGATRTGFDPQCKIQAFAPGTVGNAITFTEAMTNVTVDGSGFLGGTRLGVDRNTVPVHTFNADQYFDVTLASLSRVNVRNAGEVIWGTKQVLRDSVKLEDAASIAKFGRRFIGITEDSSGQINTLVEAQTLLQSIIEDLKEPDINQTITVPYFWPTEISDLYRYKANGRHYDSDQDLAVIAYRHSLSEDQARTTITSRGKPSTGLTSWMQREARGGVAPGIDDFSDEVVSSVLAEAMMQGLVITYDDPRARNPPMNDWAYTDCHIDTVADFTPSAANLKASGRTTRFDVGSLTPGTTFFVKLRTFDTSGNFTEITQQIIKAAEEVGPFHENLDGQQDQLLRNNDFNIYTKGTDQAPDEWTISGGSYGPSGAAFVNEVDTRTGSRTLDIFFGPIDGIATSTMVPFQDVDLAQFSAVAKFSGANLVPELEFAVIYFNAAGAEIGRDTETRDTTTGLSTAFNRFVSTVFDAPAGTKFVAMEINPASISATAFTLTVDKCALVRGKGIGIGAGGGSVPTVYTTQVMIAFTEIGLIQSGGTWSVETPGTWSISAKFLATDNSNPKQKYTYNARILQNSTTTVQEQVINSTPDGSLNQDAAVIMSQILELSVADTIEFQTFKSGSGNPTQTVEVDFIQIVREDE